QMPYAFRSRFIHKMLGEAGGERVSGADVERVSDLVERRGPGKKVRVSGGLWVSRTHDAIKLGWEKPGTNAEGFCYEIDIPGKLSIPELGIDVITHLLPGIPAPNNKTVCFDWDALDKPLFIRSRRPGDRFRPDGTGRVGKLKDYLIDAKIPVEERDQLGILASAGRVYWIIGGRRSAEGKITSETSNVVAIDVQRSR
ncbi:MAG: tRNA lysidine(34) synthetase TilS, partial [Ignavibacteriales bacterium]